MVGIGRSLLFAFAATNGGRDDGNNKPSGEPHSLSSSPPSLLTSSSVIHGGDGAGTMTTTSMSTTTEGREIDAIRRLRSLGMEKKETHRHSSLRRASVLVPLFVRDRDREDDDDDDDDDDDGVHVLLTRRPSSMKSHGGEVCLPGGKMDDVLDGMDDVRTALRETHEEVGIESHRVEVLSRMGTIESKHSLCVTPIVGWIRPSGAAEPRNLIVNPREVETAFAVPLRFFADPNNVVHEERVVWRGEEFAMRTYHYYDDDNDNDDDRYDDDDDDGVEMGDGRRMFVIWGLTAYILRRVAMLAYGDDTVD